MTKSSPNLVYILADDMGYGDLSCLNENSKVHTVHLDRMAERGMAFGDAHSSSAVCTPSRYSLLTGRYNWRSELKQGVLDGYDGPLVEQGRTTVASYLKGHGYATCCVGKWHLGWEWGRTPEGELDFSKPVKGGPVDCGFDQFFGIAASLDFPPYVYVDGNQPTTADFRMLDAEAEGYVGKRYMRSGELALDLVPERVLPDCKERACRFIREQADAGAPFFLYVPLSGPHTPILPGQFAGKSGTNAYGDFCLLVDWVVGEIADTLEACGQRDNTILIFSSDNGCSPMADFDELARCGHFPSYHFRGHKADIYEGGHRMPLLVQWPAQIAAGRFCEETVCLTDLLATVADIIGQPLRADEGEDSVSNLPLWLASDTSSAPVRQATVHHSVNGSFSIRKGRWKLELCAGSGGWSSPRPGTPEEAGLPPVQLYDLEADVGECENLQDRHPDLVAELTRLLTQYVREGRSTPGPCQPNSGPACWPRWCWASSAIIFLDIDWKTFSFGTASRFVAARSTIG